MSARRNPGDQGELFGSPAASAIWPNPNSVAHDLLTLLLRGECVSQPDFKSSCCLAAEAHCLRDLGWLVISEPVSHMGMKRQIARDRLPQSAIAAARLSQGGTA